MDASVSASSKCVHVSMSCLGHWRSGFAFPLNEGAWWSWPKSCSDTSESSCVSPIPWVPLSPVTIGESPSLPSLCCSEEPLRGMMWFCGYSHPHPVSLAYLLNVVSTYKNRLMCQGGTFLEHHSHRLWIASPCVVLAIGRASYCLSVLPPSACPSKFPSSLTLTTCLEIDTVFSPVFGVLETPQLSFFGGAGVWHWLVKII